MSTPIIVNDDAGDVIACTPGLIDEITQTYMPTIASELTSLSTTLNSASLLPTTRDPALGLGSHGPSAAWYGSQYW